MKQQQGFTLIEMLIAATVMMAVLMIASSGYSFFADRWRADNSGHRQHVAQKRTQMMMMDVLNGIVPFFRHGESRSEESFYLFEGDNHHLKAVSAKPIFSSSLAIVQIEAIDMGNGKWQLLYKEAPLTAPIHDEGEPSFVYEKVLFEDLEQAGFRFYGWPNYEARTNYFDSGVGTPQWLDQYSSKKARIMPYAIGITMNREALRVLLPSDQGKMLGYASDTWGKQ